MDDIFIGLWDDATHPGTTPRDILIDRIAARLYERRYRKPWSESSDWSRREAREDAVAALALSPLPPPKGASPARD